jgi:hypothetical protein
MMSKFLSKSFFVSPTLLAATLMVSGNALAATQTEAQNGFDFTSSPVSGLEVDATLAQATPDPNQLLQRIEQYGNEGQGANAVDQVNSVTQFRDVQPTDWAYEALRGLVERYGCIAGYPNGTYRGNRALTRYEFAAGLYSCLLQIERLIAASTGDGDGVPPEDLATLERLLTEFEAELATLGTRVDNLEARLGEVEENQFSTTTKLAGEVAFVLSDVFGGEDVDGFDVADNNNTVFQNRVRLAFVTSFTGEDALYTRLDAGNSAFFNGIDQGQLTTNFDNGNDIEIGWLAYYFPVGERIQVYLPAAFPLWQDFVPTISPLLDDFTGASRSLSSFGESSPIYKIGLPSGGGVGFNFELSESLLVSAGYFGGDTANPSSATGLFDGSYAALGQLTWSPSDRFQLGLTYVNNYGQNGLGVAPDNPNPDTLFDLGVGTANAKVPFGNVSYSSNSYGVQGYFGLSDKFGINAFGGLTQAESESGANEGSEADIYYYGVGLAFPDLGKEGNLGGIIVGAEPYVESFEDQNGNDIAANEDDPAYHIEGFYKYALTDNISVTPGVIWLTAPGGDEDNDDVFIGVLRTTFVF